MALILNEEQRMLEDAARDFLQSRAPVSHLRELRDGDECHGYSKKLWQDLADMGWPATLVPEEHGGIGYGYTGIGIILQQCGRTLTPSPLLSSALIGVTALLKGGSDSQRETMLPAIAAGEQIMALAVDDSAHHNPDNCQAVAEMENGQYLLSGRKVAVIDGHIADTLIVSARTDDGGTTSLFLVAADAEGVTVTNTAALDTHRLANIQFDKVQLEDSALLGELNNGGALLDTILDAARIGQSAELLGIAEEAFERTIDYLQQRKQFGVLIGSFQALQHRAAEMFTEIELCKSAVLNALQALDEGRGNVGEIASMTKAKLCETAHRVTTEAVQMHGGIGMTDEFDIGFFLKRSQILEALLGDYSYHVDRFARLRGY
ncbi:MAG: acyl-CoA dehydrogenase family protein [Anderseniella sp.]